MMQTCLIHLHAVSLVRQAEAKRQRQLEEEAEQLAFLARRKAAEAAAKRAADDDYHAHHHHFHHHQHEHHHHGHHKGHHHQHHQEESGPGARLLQGCRDSYKLTMQASLQPWPWQSCMDNAYCSP